MCVPLSNRLLNSLSASARQILEPKLKAVALPAGTLIFEAGREPTHTYFITSGVASVVTEMQEGGVVEVELLGREALPGCLRLLGDLTQPSRCVMQVAGTGLQISFKELSREFRTNAELHTRILQQVQYKAFSLSQLSACNRLHGVDNRLARLLLMVADRLEDHLLPLTQEFLGEMLGTRRSTVTVAAGVLQSEGVIAYHRGSLHINDRVGLERRACECYFTMRQFFKDLYSERLHRMPPLAGHMSMAAAAQSSHQ